MEDIHACSKKFSICSSCSACCKFYDHHFLKMVIVSFFIQRNYIETFSFTWNCVLTLHNAVVFSLRITYKCFEPSGFKSSGQMEQSCTCRDTTYTCVSGTKDENVMQMLSRPDIYLQNLTGKDLDQYLLLSSYKYAENRWLPYYRYIGYRELKVVIGCLSSVIIRFHSFSFWEAESF